MPEAKDYLARYNTQIVAHFPNEATTEELYCDGVRGWNWEEICPFTTSPGAYENSLLEFFRHDPGRRTQHTLNIVVMVGGVGTGKTTALRRILHKFTSSARTCSRASGEVCHTTPIIIDLDLREVYPIAIDRRRSEKLGETEQIEAFWRTVAGLLHRLTPPVFTYDTEVAFWRFSLEKSDIGDRSGAIQRWLAANERQIRAVSNNEGYTGWSVQYIAQLLERERAEFMRTLAPQDLAWYRIYQLAFALDRQDAPCVCRYIVIDNVDHLEPAVQRIAVELVERMATVLRARAVISIRPHTWYRAFDAHVLVRTESHCSPLFRDVLQKRLASLKKEGSVPPNAVALLELLINELTSGGDHLWSEMFEATCGLSVRFALRNLANMTQSPLLPPVSEPPRTGPNAGMKASEFARAYFFGDGDAMIRHAFENLYRVGNDMRYSYRLIKVRILDFVIRIDGGATHLARLRESLKPFGYDPNIVIKAINELLRETRPLLWSHEGHDAAKMSAPAELAITPIGSGYYESLFGQLYYDEACIASDARSVVNPELVVAFHKDIREQDEREIRQFLRSQTPHRYLSLYPIEALGISVVHARKLRVGFEKRRAALPIGFDSHNDDYIQRRIGELLDLPTLDA